MVELREQVMKMPGGYGWLVVGLSLLVFLMVLPLFLEKKVPSAEPSEQGVQTPGMPGPGMPAPGMQRPGH